MTISDQKSVLIHYTMKNDQGKVLNRSIGHSPLAYLQGDRLARKINKHSVLCGEEHQGYLKQQ